MKLLTAGLLLCASTLGADVPIYFTDSAIVPDVINTAPNELATVIFKGSNGEDKDLQFGEELTPTFVKDPPTIKWSVDDSAFYTIAMIDPDSPSSQDPKFREILHWMVTNVPGIDVSKGDVNVEYIAVGPSKDTGLHRCIMLVYKQPNKLDLEMPPISKFQSDGRRNFVIRDFASKYNLGEPVAGNMFKAQYDDYVPVMRKQLGLMS